MNDKLEIAEIDTSIDTDDVGIFYWSRFKFHKEISSSGETQEKAKANLMEHAAAMHRIIGGMTEPLSEHLQNQLDFLNKIFRK